MAVWKTVPWILLRLLLRQFVIRQNTKPKRTLANSPLLQGELKSPDIRVEGKTADQNSFFKIYRILSPNHSLSLSLSHTHTHTQNIVKTIFCFVTLIYVAQQWSFGLNNDGTLHDYNKPVGCLRLLTYWADGFCIILGKWHSVYSSSFFVTEHQTTMKPTKLIFK